MNKTQIEAILTTTNKTRGWSDGGRGRGNSERDAVGEEGIKKEKKEW